MTRIERALSRVLPPRTVWAIALLSLVVVLTLCWFVRTAMRAWGAGAEGSFYVYYLAATLCLGLFGMWRAGFHPAMNRGYADWLATTPWTPDKPLPGGPILLTWQDAALVAGLSASFALPGQFGLAFALTWPPLAFLGAYVLCLSLANLDTGEGRAFVIATAAALALPLAVGRSGGESTPLAVPTWTAWSITALSYAAGAWGVRRGLRSLPWPDNRRTCSAALVNASLEPPTIVPPLVHWEGVAALSPLSRSRVGAIAGLAGWGAFTLAECFERLGVRGDQAPTGPGLAVFVALFLAAARTLRYGWGHQPPISPLGRIAMRRIIIPGYDKMLVGPAAIVLSAIAVPWALGKLHAPAPIIDGATAAAMTSAAFGIGPSLRDWHLTGEHRMRLSVQRTRVNRVA